VSPLCRRYLCQRRFQFLQRYTGLHPSHQSNPTTEDGEPRTSRIAGAVVLAVSIGAATVSRAQNFAVDKWNIGGEGGTDYVTAEAGTGRVFVSRETRVVSR
jgi:hypothetical protein